jgi:hypothetical protein
MAVVLPLYASPAKDGTPSPQAPGKRGHGICVAGLCLG